MSVTPAVASVVTSASAASSMNKGETNPGVNDVANGESPQPPTKMPDATRNLQVSAFA